MIMFGKFTKKSTNISCLVTKHRLGLLHPVEIFLEYTRKAQ